MLCLSVALSSCGIGFDESDRVEEAVKGLYDAFAAKDARTACSSLTIERRRQVSRSEGSREGCVQCGGWSTPPEGPWALDAHQARINGLPGAIAAATTCTRFYSAA